MIACKYPQISARRIFCAIAFIRNLKTLNLDIVPGVGGPSRYGFGGSLELRGISNSKNGKKVSIGSRVSENYFGSATAIQAPMLGLQTKYRFSGSCSDYIWSSNLISKWRDIIRVPSGKIFLYVLSFGWVWLSGTSEKKSHIFLYGKIVTELIVAETFYENFQTQFQS